MQLHQHQRTQTQRSHLTLDQSPRSTPIPGSLSMQDHFNIYQGNSGSNNDYSFKYNNGSIGGGDINTKHSFNGSSSLQKTLQSSAFNKQHRILGISAGEPPTPSTTPSSQTNSISIDEFYYNASKNSSTSYNNNSNSLYQQQLRRHLHNKSTSDTNGSIKDVYHQASDLTSMTTDDEASSTASFRQRSRKLSKAGSIPSPLSGASSFSTIKNSSSNALSTLSFLSTGDKADTANNAADTNAKTASQLRVRHLEQQSSYAGYLTKFSSRTFFSRKQWKRRYFILSNKILYCFKSSDPQHPLLESIALSPETIICVTDIFSGKRFCLEISCPGEKSWYVLADTAPEMSGWLKELKNTVHHIRNTQLGTRPETLYSESSEVSDFSGISATKVPNVPAIPSQYEYLNGASRSLPGTLSSTSSSLPRQVQQANFESQQQQQQQPQQHNLDIYHCQVTSLNPPPRPITPKPSTPTPGSSPQNSPGSPIIHSYRASPQPQPQQSQQSQQPQQPQQPETRRRRNSSLSTGQPSSDYVSFGSVMQRAEAMAEVQRESPSSSWSIPTKAELSEGNYATLPRSKRESAMSTMSNATITSTISSATPRNHGASTTTDRPESTILVPHRNIQRLMGSSSRPASSFSTRPLSPTLSRSSPRNSLVIAPPPRSALRPASVSIRHSTQILPLPQIVTAGLPSQHSNSPITSSPPTSSLPATPDSNGHSNHTASLSRITSIRHQRDPGLNRHSMISSTSALSGFSNGTGSIQERVQRASSRASIMRSPSVAVGGLPIRPAVPSDLLNMNRPLSPTPSLAAAPTFPLPEPPGSGSSSSSSVAGSTQSTPPVSPPSSDATDLSRRHSSVPRHHEPDLPIPNRSKARVRSQSQEAALISAKLGDLQLSHGANTPSPRLSAVLTPNKDHSSVNSVGNNNNHTNKQMSLPIHTMYVLPEPPTGQVPAQPSGQVSSNLSRHLMQKPSGSSAALRPISSSMNNVASLGGGIARKPSATNTAAIAAAAASKRDSLLSPRPSALISLPLGPTTAMPLPPKSALPAPPTSALPKKPIEMNKKPETKKIKAGQINKQAGFDIIIEEEEEDDSNENDEDDDEGEEYESRLQFEELEAAKAATEQELDPESTATTPTTATRPEYYATKERKVVEYIFPSESFSV
ncbi:hypothetical protein BGX26_006154 [Mortierella sp. AD094]|nr:hypothetical protein BGX26_006154 [Mortierella sp. AD094]